ncbi:hypothetical protein BLA39750_05408 [Burkholderia lata]|uniref:Uncharacterized protein n=1 Tax=Burkholderia lata (strain ATCC 17760 / DSM 23089 / LMG 22485 / NCIMB 9086 / R18194 / 383) TaxID=482957 RepID=A0A6P3A4N1_BURL3|nr:hypothetical protein BLA39750_05408 [Burkholderia lata]
MPGPAGGAIAAPRSIRTRVSRRTTADADIALASREGVFVWVPVSVGRWASATLRTVVKVRDDSRRCGKCARNARTANATARTDVAPASPRHVDGFLDLAAASRPWSRRACGIVTLPDGRPRQKAKRGPRAFVSHAGLAGNRRAARYPAVHGDETPSVSFVRSVPPRSGAIVTETEARQTLRSRHPPRRDTRQAGTQKSQALCDTGPGFPSIRFNLYSTSTKHAAAPPSRPGTAHASSSVSAAVLGKRTMKRLPCPGVDVTSIEPPWRTTTAFTNGNPRPTPRLASRCEPSI